MSRDIIYPSPWPHCEIAVGLSFGIARSLDLHQMPCRCPFRSVPWPRLRKKKTVHVHKCACARSRRRPFLTPASGQFVGVAADRRRRHRFLLVHLIHSRRQTPLAATARYSTPLLTIAEVGRLPIFRHFVVKHDHYLYMHTLVIIQILITISSSYDPRIIVTPPLSSKKNKINFTHTNRNRRIAIYRWSKMFRFDETAVVRWSKGKCFDFRSNVFVRGAAAVQRFYRHQSVRIRGSRRRRQLLLPHHLATTTVAAVVL